MAMRSRMRSLLASSAVIGVSALGSTFLPTAASAVTCSGSADTVCIGISDNAGGGTAPSGTVAQGTAGAGTASINNATNFGFKYSVSASGIPTLSPPNVLDSNTLDIENTNGTAGLGQPFYVWVTETGLTTTAALQSFLSTFTVEALQGGWTVNLSTYVDPGNHAYTLTDLVGSLAASSLTTGSGGTTVAGLSTFSATEVFQINDVSGQSGDDASLAINLYTTPLPGTLPLFASGLAGLWAWGRRRTRGQKPGSLESAMA